MTEQGIRRNLRESAKRLNNYRAAASRAESDVQDWIMELASVGHGTMEKFRIEVGVSKAHISDIRHRRRGVGESTARKIAGLK